MKQGTVSIIIGCHSPIHSLLVLLAWKRLFGYWPKRWQIICIFLHDIGHIGLDYLDNYEQKKKHWILGANVCGKLFGKKGYEFAAGHSSHSGYESVELYKADKYSWYIAPTWWLLCNQIFEPKLRMGYNNSLEAVRAFQKQVKKNIDENNYRSTHELYLERCKDK
jgi:hypothetical protein